MFKQPYVPKRMAPLSTSIEKDELAYLANLSLKSGYNKAALLRVMVEIFSRSDVSWRQMQDWLKNGLLSRPED